MESRLNRRFFTAFALAAMVGMTACDDDDDGIIDPTPDPEPSAIELYTADDDVRVAHTVGNAWEGNIPTVSVGETRVLEVVVLDEDGDPINLGTQFTVQAMVESESPDDVATIENVGDSVRITGVTEGETMVVFQVREGTDVVFEPNPIQVVVGELDTEPAGVQLYDRETDELITETEGTGEEMEWTEEMPDLGVGETLEVDVIFVNAAGQRIPLEENESVQAEVAEGEDDDVVEIEHVENHVVLSGAAAGETALVFSRLQNETVQFSSPPLAVEVVAGG